MIKQGDILDEWGGRTWKVLGIEDDVAYIELTAVPFWDTKDNIGESDVILTKDIYEG